MLANGKERETTGAIAVLEDVSGLQDQRLANKINQASAPLAVAERFFALYPNRVQAILCPRGCRDWTTISKHWPMTDETVLAAVAGSESSIYGLRWAERTRFAVLDIDKNSKYRSDLELAKLQERLAAVGLTAKIYRSSDSSGWHLYLFLDDWADSGEVNEHLSTWLRLQGYEIRGGVLEVFPSGMGLRLPLQPGFAWLDEKGSLIQTREELTTDEALASFLCDLEKNKRNWSEAKNRIKTELEVIDRAIDRGALVQQERLETEGFDGLFNYRLIPEKYEEGRSAWHDGLTRKGQRHDAILGIEHYLWHGDKAAGVPALPGEWNDEQRYRLILAWLQANHNGFCNHINRGNWRKVEAQVRRAVKWRRFSDANQVRTPYPLTEKVIERLIALSKSTGRTWSMEDLKKGNDGREAEAREKIRVAIPLLIKLGQKLTVKGLALASGCSRTTVRRHLDIWKISPTVALSKCTGDQNPFLDLDLLGGGGTRALGSEEKDLDPLAVVADSGDLGSVQEFGVTDSRVVGMVPQQPCELAPILVKPPFLLPGFKPTSELPVSISNRSLNGVLPSSAEPPPGPFHLPRFPIDTGALVRWYLGRTANDAGGLEPIPLNQPVYAIRVEGRGNKARLILPVINCCIRVSGFRWQFHAPKLVAGSACYQLPGKCFGILVYGGVRGPPPANRA